MGCSLEESKQAIIVANMNDQVKNKVKYAIGIIVLQTNKKNSFSNFPQINYSKEDFLRMERLLLQKGYEDYSIAVGES